MFGLIELWKERWDRRKRRKRTLKDIKKAKKVYLDNKEKYMCYCFKHVDKDKYSCLENIQEYIPEFNPTYLNAEEWASKYTQWWDVSDRESRIKAFNKLIDLYSKKNRRTYMCDLEHYLNERNIPLTSLEANSINEGVEWGLEKACEYLRTHLWQNKDADDDPIVESVHNITLDDFIKDLKRYVLEVKS